MIFLCSKMNEVVFFCRFWVAGMALEKCLLPQVGDFSHFPSLISVNHRHICNSSSIHSRFTIQLQPSRRYSMNICWLVIRQFCSSPVSLSVVIHKFNYPPSCIYFLAEEWVIGDLPSIKGTLNNNIYSNNIHYD